MSLGIISELVKPIGRRSSDISKSVDIPSGWDVDKGNTDPESSFIPDVLISLSAPKLGAVDYDKACSKAASSSEKDEYQHWLGGRFISPHIDETFGLELPEWAEDNLDQCMDITHIDGRGKPGKSPKEEDLITATTENQEK